MTKRPIEYSSGLGVTHVRVMNKKFKHELCICFRVAEGWGFLFPENAMNIYRGGVGVAFSGKRNIHTYSITCSFCLHESLY